jgi:excinuclease UvrABC ATPase subunit
LGPEGGTMGGKVVSLGAPRILAKNDHTHTERALNRFF